MNQKEVWSNFRAGDKAAFESVYKLCVDDMFAYGLKLNPNKELVQDCLQQVFIDIYERRNKISQPTDIKFYFLKALKHSIYKRQKKENKQTHFEDIANFEFNTEYNFEDKRILSEIDTRKKQLIGKVVDSLSNKQREIMYLRFTVGLGYDEIAEIIAIDSNSVRKQVYRAIKKLRNSEVFDDYKSTILFYSSVLVK